MVPAGMGWANMPHPQDPRADSGEHAYASTFRRYGHERGNSRRERGITQQYANNAVERFPHLFGQAANHWRQGTAISDTSSPP